MKPAADLRDSLKRRLASIEGLRRLYGSVRRIQAPLMAWKFRRENTGAATHIDPSAHFLGWRQIKIGMNCLISADCWFNVNHRETNAIAIHLGDNCFIGRRNFFSSGRLIKIGDYGLIGADCRFLGSDHIFSDPFAPYISTGTTADNTIAIGTNCWIGAGSTFIGNVNIGHGCIIGAGSLVKSDAPPFSIVVGTPGRIIKRFNMDKFEWVNVGLFTPEMEANLPDENLYLRMLKARSPNLRMPLAASSQSRGDLP